MRQQVPGSYTTYRQTVGFQSGHAASGGGSGVQHVLLRHFELSALWRHIAVPHGHQNWIFVAAVQPLLGLHGGLRTRCVRVQVVLEEVRLCKKRRKWFCFVVLLKNLSISLFLSKGK